MSEEPTQAEQVRSWLQAVYGGMPGLIAVSHFASGGVRTSCFGTEADDLDLATNHIVEMSLKYDVYVRTTTLRDAPRDGGRGDSSNTLSFLGLHADIDIAGPNHKGSAYPPTIEAALGLLDEVGISATAVVASGGGLQAWWLFEEPWIIGGPEEQAEAETLLKRLEAHLESVCRPHGWGVDHTFELSRILRPPGTFNHKQDAKGAAPVPVQLLSFDQSKRLGVKDLEDFLPELTKPAPATLRSSPPQHTQSSDGRLAPSEILESWSWADILSPHGFYEMGKSGYWKHPAATSPAGTPTCTTDVKGTPVLVMHSSTVSDFLGLPAGKDQKLTKLRVFAILNHGGEETLASRDILQRTYVDWEAPTDLRDLIGPNARASKPKAPSAKPIAAEIDPTSIEWQEPSPLVGQLDPPPFPVETLPSWIADQVMVQAKQKQVPVDLLAQLAIGNLAAACSGRLRVVNATWTEDVNLYLVTTGDVGSSKSPCEKVMGEPLRVFCAERMEQSRAALSEAQLRHELLEAQAAAARKTAEKLGANIDDAVRARKILDEHVMPVSPRIHLDDITPESLTDMLSKHNNGHMAMISAEAGLFGIVQGGYSPKVNLDVYLKAWSGDPITVDRKGSGDRGPTSITIPRPLLTVCVTPQPFHLKALREHPELSGRGFTERFMFAMPTDLSGTRDRRMYRKVSATAAAAAFSDTFLRIARHMYSCPDMVYEIRVADDAGEMFDAWTQNHEDQTGPGGALRYMRGWLRKQEASVLRVAGLLHAADELDYRAPIDIQIMTRAIAIGDYWMEHYRGARELWQSDEATDSARHVLEWLETRMHGRDRVSLHDVHQGLRSSAEFAKPTDLLAPLQLLGEHGYVVPLFEGVPKTGRGVKSPEWALNPKVSEDRKDIALKGGFLTKSLSPDTPLPPNTPLSTMSFLSSLALVVDTPPERPFEAFDPSLSDDSLFA